MFKLNADDLTNLSSDLSSYVAIPLDVLKQNMEQSIMEQSTQQVHNFIIQTLPNGKLCLINGSELLTQFEADSNTIIQNDDDEVENISVNTSVDLGSINNQFLNFKTNDSVIDNNTAITTINEVISEGSETIAFSCVTCNKQFDKLSKFRKHFAKHEFIKKYKCSQCTASYNIESNLLLHTAMHDQNKLTCPVCKVNFNRAASLKSHLMLHQIDEAYSCDECMAEFDHEEELHMHKKGHLKVKEKPKGLVCSYCKLPFENQTEYKEHVSYHVKVKKLVLKSKKSRKTNGNITYAHACKTCGKSFPKCSLLERHERIHSGEKPYPCTLCSRAFNQKGTLKIHLIKHSGSKPFNCTLCPAKFAQKGNLRAHFTHTHTAPPPGQKVYKCTQCTCIFKRVASLNAHMTKTHSETTATENTDEDNMSALLKQLEELEKQVAVLPTTKNEALLTSSSLSNNNNNNNLTQSDDVIESARSEQENKYVKLTESGVDGNIRRYIVRLKKIGDTRWYRCNYCSKESKKPSDLIRHIRTHTREKPFECNICRSAFSLKSTLTSHLRTHSTRRGYKCNVCLKSFSSTRTLNMHLQNHERKAKQSFQCNICNLTFKSTDAANNHQNFHKADKLSCQNPVNNNNSNIFMKQPLLETAEGILPVAAPRSMIPYTLNESQQEERPHRCQFCNAAFKKNDHLQRHILIHTGEKKHKCDECLKCFTTSSSLREHMLFHKGIKNYGCKICGRRFVTSSLLKRHVLMHSTLKPYICPYCNKKFKNVMLCRKHIKIHKKDVVVTQNNTDESENTQETAKIIDLADTLKDHPFSIPNISTFDMNSLVSNDVNTEINIGTVSETNTAKKQNTAKKKIKKPVVENDSVITLHKGILDDDVPTLVEELPQENVQTLQTLCFKCDNPNADLPLNESVNLNAIYPQLKLQNADSLLLNTLNEMNNSNILFNIETLNTELDSQSFQVFNNQILDLPSESAASQKNTNKKDDAVVNEDFQDLTSLRLNVITNNETQDFLSSSLQLRDDGTLLITDNEVPILCTDCNVIFTNLNDFKLHDCMVKNTQQHKEVTPDSIDKVTPVQVDESNNNINNKVEEGPQKKPKKKVFECAICKSVFENRKLYIEHLSVHKSSSNGSNNLHQCTYCEKSFKKPSDLIRHLRTHTGEKPFACEKCDKKFTLKSTLESHYRTHDPVQHKKYKCDICNTFFSTKASLKVHLYIHTDTKPHHCSYCTMKFRTASRKKAHEENQHSQKKITNHKLKPMDILLNSIMPGEYKQSNSVLRKNVHDLQQEEERQQIETLAVENIPLSQSSDLLNELTGSILTLDQLQSSNILLPDNLTIDANNLIHIDENILIGIKNISADLTTYSNNEDNVISIPEEHDCNERNYNNKVRNFECSICHKRFGTKDVLKKHEKIHGINKKFPCTKCDKGFNSKLELEFHFKQHAGYRLYSCILCNNSFSEEAGLKTHIRRIHPSYGISGDIIT